MPREKKTGQTVPARYWPGRDQRDRAAAPPVEPARDIDIERRVDAGIAEQPDENAVPDIERGRRARARYREAGGDHRRAEHDDAADAEAFGHPAHRDAADRRAEPGERTGQRRHRARVAQLGGDRLQRDDGDDRRAERHRVDRQRGQRDDPRGARLDRGRADVVPALSIGKAIGRPGR